MNDNAESTAQNTPEPDEQGGINLRSFVKIFDPETNEVLVTDSE